MTSFADLNPPPLSVPVLADLDKRFDYHRPNEIRAACHEHVRETLRSAAAEILSVTKPSREQALALTHLEEAMMWANAAIARNGTTLEGGS